MTWNITIEWCEFLSAARILEVADFVKSIDPWDHLVSAHDQGSSPPACEITSGEALGSALHVDYASLQTSAGNVQSALAANTLVTKYSGTMPTYAQEVTWEASTKLTGRQVREGAWGVALGGAIVNYAEMFEGPNFRNPSNFGDGAALPDLEILLDFMESIPYYEMDPHNELVNTGSICFAKPGTEYVVYRQHGGTFTLDLTGMTGTFDVEWLNPRTGSVISSGQVAGGSSQSFAAQDNNDWVLHIIPP